MVAIQARDYFYYDDYHWWYSDTALIVKWSIGAALIAIALGYFGGGYIHAKNRLAKGLPPLAYHRWMVRRQMHPQAYNPSGYYNDGSNQNPNTYGHYGAGSQPYQAPPPVYNPRQGPPPSYYPAGNNMQDIPLNATKANPDQHTPGQQQYGVINGENSGSTSRP